MCSVLRKRSAKRRLDDLLRRAAQPLTHTRELFWRLIRSIQAKSPLLAPVPHRGRVDPQAKLQMALACVRMANRHEHWLSTPEEWTAPAASPFVQFRSLVTHLFDRYPVPNFMSPVWLRVEDKPWELEMYLHLAEGRSIRQFPLPVPFRLSKRAAVYFMQAPDDLHPVQSLRWGQVRALGGDARLARLLSCRTILVAPTDSEEFWESVIRFLVRNAAISDSEVVSIVEFIHQQRFQPASALWGPWAGTQPVQPNFTLEGRSLNSLRRHMTHWRTEVTPRVTPVAPLPSLWERTAIQPFRHTTAEGLWTIDELLTEKELRVEGGIMRHCVASYISACARRRTSIWSLKLHREEHRERVATIEVVPQTRIIWQAKGRQNAPPSPSAMDVVQRWAGQEGLKFREMA
jgi:hypothetical protein